MKNYIYSIIAIAALLVFSTSNVLAATIKVNGTTVYTGGQGAAQPSPYSGTEGTVSAVVAENTLTCTLTVTPAEGYLLRSLETRLP